MGSAMPEIKWCRNNIKSMFVKIIFTGVSYICVKMVYVLNNTCTTRGGMRNDC